MYVGPLTKVIPLKLFLDMVPSSSADITLALCGCFHGGFVYVVSFQSKGKPPTLWGCHIMSYFDYEQGSFGFRYVLINFETILSV